MNAATPNGGTTDRRDFLKAGTAGIAALAIAPSLSARAYAAGSENLRVGLVGCGGRGTGAAADALSADSQARLVAVGDVFADQIEGSLKNLATTHAEQVKVDAEHRFVGFDAFKKVIDSSDVVLLCTPPHFRPEQLRAAIEAGKHVFVEKPVAVDGAGVRHVLESCRMAKEKNLSVVSGLCWRYHPAVKAAFDEVLSGRIGDVVAVRCSYLTRQLSWTPRRPEWTDMEHQLRNWQYYTWLSSDHIAEQHVHSIDKMLWALGDKPPVTATGVGGRELREPERGDVYDHFAIEYQFENDVTGFGRCRQQDPCAVDVTDTVYGTKGLLQVASHRVFIRGENPWKYRGEDGNMYRLEHEAFFKSIRDGEPINNGDYMSSSTMTALLGREAAYTGQVVRYDELMKSDVRLGPAKYEWGSLPNPPVRKPGDKPVA